MTSGSALLLTKTLGELHQFGSDVSYLLAEERPKHDPYTP